MKRKKILERISAGDRKIYDWNLPRLRQAIVAVALCTLTGTFVTFYKLGGIPVFIPGGVGNVNPMLGAVVKGIFAQLHYFNSIALFLCLIYVMKNPRDIVVLTVGGLTCLALLGYGGRYPFVLPIVTSFFIYNHYIKEVGLRKSFMVFISVAILLMAYGWWRNRLMEATSFAGVKGEDTDVVATIGNVFTELRDFGLWIKEFEFGGPGYLGIILIVGALMAMFPKQIWGLIGIDKDRYLINSAYLTGTVIYHESYTGIRIGLIGELFISFGIIGIMIGMGLLGGIFAALDNKLLSVGQKGAQVPIIYYVSFVLTFSLIGHLEAVVASLTYYGFVLYAAYYYARSQNHELQ